MLSCRNWLSIAQVLTNSTPLSQGAMSLARQHASIRAISLPSLRGGPYRVPPHRRLDLSVKTQRTLREEEIPAGFPDIQCHFDVEKLCDDLACKVGRRAQTPTYRHTGDQQTRHAHCPQIAVHIGCQPCSPSLSHSLAILFHNSYKPHKLLHVCPTALFTIVATCHCHITTFIAGRCISCPLPRRSHTAEEWFEEKTNW